MAYRYSRPPHGLREWQVFHGESRWVHERGGMPRWLLAFLAVLLLVLGWALFANREPAGPDEAPPIMLDNP